MLLRDAHNLRHLGFRDFEIVHPADAFALGVYLQHDLRRARALHAEDRLEDIHNELHRRKVVIDQYDPEKRRLLEFRSRLLNRQIVIVMMLFLGSLFTHR